MENIENWIYIVFILVAAVSSIIKSVNKKRPADAQRPSMREVIVADDKNDEDFLPLPFPVPFNKPAKRQPQAAKRPAYQAIQEGESSFESEQSKDDAAESEPTGIMLDGLPSTTNEWRKAFLYSEIFTRKH